MGGTVVVPSMCPREGMIALTDELMDPAEAFARLGKIKLSDTDLAGVLDTIAGLAKRTIPGADAVSVTLMRDKKAWTAASTDELALTLDEAQYESGGGPCLDAAAAGATVPVADTGREDRWPYWASQAVENGVRSSLSIGLPVEEAVTGALNIYATTSEAFDEDATVVAQTFAGYAAVALANAHLYNTTVTLARQMQAAMEGRAVIEQAKGIIMGARYCGADEAFRVLVTISQNTNSKLRDVAAALVARAEKSESDR